MSTTLIEQMGTLADQARQAAADQRAKAASDYSALLARAAAPKPGDLQRLQSAMELLGISPTDFANACTVAKQIAHLEREIPTPDEVAEAGAAQTKALQHARDMEELSSAAEKALHAANHRNSSVQIRRDSNTLKIGELKLAHAKILNPK